ncbi:hypothetical protein V5O48_014051 [Marasmius crinis-equi]|uniref:F-box domain-containing protein n=1 Tax=Marasmius crinis-equi TaxID=585013 RepID=A0ABR3EYC8_9AGAR
MLPPEILIHIFSQAHNQALCSCCLVNSSWHDLAQPVLFSDLNIEFFGSRPDDLERAKASVQSYKALLESIDKRPKLASYIRNLLLAHYKRVRGPPQVLQEQIQYMGSLLPKLTRLRSIEWHDVDYSFLSRECRIHMRALFALPSLTSIKLTDVYYPSAFELVLFTITPATNLRTLHLSNINFHTTHLGPGGDFVIPCSADTSKHAPPRSIRLTYLCLQRLDVRVITSFFAASHCPFSFESLRTLYLIHPTGGRSPKDNPFNYPSDIEPGALMTLLRAVGRNVKDFVLGYSRPRETTVPLLRFTPTLKSLFLAHISHLSTYHQSAIDRIRGLFPPTPSAIEDITIFVEVTETFSCTSWQDLDAFFADVGHFPSLRNLDLRAVSSFAIDSGSEGMESLVESQFPMLLQSKKLTVKRLG